MRKQPTLLQLRRTYNQVYQRSISSYDLARAANIPLALSFAVEVGGFAQIEIAQRVLQAFSHLIGITLSLADIQIHTEPVYC
jgi:hypothetical protein